MYVTLRFCLNFLVRIVCILRLLSSWTLTLVCIFVRSGNLSKFPY
jgi:hypothetical protein